MPIRPIFLIHGVGNHKRGQFLSAVTEPLIQFLDTELGHEYVEAEVHLRPEHGPAHATLKFEDEEWQIWEAYWQESFYPLKSYWALTWGFNILRYHAWSMLKGFIPYLRGKDRYDNSKDPI